MKIVTVDQMIELERRSADLGAPPDFLMENAGLAVANAAKELIEDVATASIVLMIGPGNNGGDGLVAARHLHDWGAKVELFLVKRKTESDRNFELVMERRIAWTAVSGNEDISKLAKSLSSAGLVIDSLFGTGKVRPLEGVVKEMLETVASARQQRSGLKVLAVDLPSGLNADTGAVDPATLRADLTVTFACPKTGLYRFPGAEYLGRLEVADIGIPEHLAEPIPVELIDTELVGDLLPTRRPNANKGTFGKVLVIAGSMNYVGAAYLVCEAAMRVGAGLVTLAAPQSLHPILASKLTEATHLPLPEDKSGDIDPEAVWVVKGQLAGYDAVVLGCGLGQKARTAEFVEKVVKELPPGTRLVIDADGLNILAEKERWWEMLPAETVLTPHPGEMARLTGKSVAEIQADRQEAVSTAAREWQRCIVLKGAFTAVASPEGAVRICGMANAGLASAGTGDVLSGAIGGLIAQGLSPFEAATCGVYVHAMAGELVKVEFGDAGMVASDLLPVLPLVISDSKSGRC